MTTERLSVESSDMARAAENGRVSVDIPEEGGCCCGCGWKVGKCIAKRDTL